MALPTTFPFTLTPVDGGDTLAVFQVPDAAVERLVATPVVANQGCFRLEPVPEQPGQVQTRFYSPKPEALAEAIAAKMAYKVSQGAPPDMREQCVLM